MSKKLKNIFNFIAFIALGVISVLTLLRDVGVASYGVSGAMIIMMIVNILMGVLLAGIFTLTLINNYIRKTKIAWITALEKAMEIMTYLLFAMTFVMLCTICLVFGEVTCILGMINVLLMLFVVAVKLITKYVPDKEVKAEEKAEAVAEEEVVEEKADEE